MDHNQVLELEEACERAIVEVLRRAKAAKTIAPMLKSAIDDGSSTTLTKFCTVFAI